MMTRRQPAARPAPRLYLITQRMDDADALSLALGSLPASLDVAAVLLRTQQDTDERSIVKLVKAVAPAVQQTGAAVLLDGHPDIVARAGADGVHLHGVSGLREVSAALQPQRIVGVGGVTTRHDAMLAGEGGADYVAFGDAEDVARRAAFGSVLDRVAWWSEVFEIPCVGFADTPDQIAQLAAAGADFVAVCDMIWSDPRGIAAAAASAVQMLSAAEPVR